MSTAQWLTALGGALLGLGAAWMGVPVHAGTTTVEGPMAYVLSMAGGVTGALCLRYILRRGVWG